MEKSPPARFDCYYNEPRKSRKDKEQLSQVVRSFYRWGQNGSLPANAKSMRLREKTFTKGSSLQKAPFFVLTQVATKLPFRFLTH